MKPADAFRERINRQIKAQQDDPFHEIQSQIRWLEQEVAREMAELRTLSHALKVMRAEMQAFTSDYYYEVGDLSERLRRLEKELERHHYRDTAPQGGDTDIDAVLKELNFSFAPTGSVDMSAADVKSLYRKLAKVLHPDAAPENPRAAEMFALLNASYMNKDVVTLEYLKVEFLGEDESGNNLPEENPVQKLERLEQEYDAIRNAADRARIEKHELATSPAYKLQQHVCWHKMCGNDLIGLIKERLKSDIRRKELVLAGLEHASMSVS